MATDFGMEITIPKLKMVAVGQNIVRTKIILNYKYLEEIQIFKHLWNKCKLKTFKIHNIWRVLKKILKQKSSRIYNTLTLSAVFTWRWNMDFETRR